MEVAASSIPPRICPSATSLRCCPLCHGAREALSHGVTTWHRAEACGAWHGRAACAVARLRLLIVAMLSPLLTTLLLALVGCGFAWGLSATTAAGGETGQGPYDVVGRALSSCESRIRGPLSSRAAARAFQCHCPSCALRRFAALLRLRCAAFECNYASIAYYCGCRLPKTLACPAALDEMSPITPTLTAEYSAAFAWGEEWRVMLDFHQVVTGKGRKQDVLCLSGMRLAAESPFPAVPCPQPLPRICRASCTPPPPAPPLPTPRHRPPTTWCPTRCPARSPPAAWPMPRTLRRRTWPTSAWCRTTLRRAWRGWPWASPRPATSCCTSAT